MDGIGEGTIERGIADQLERTRIDAEIEEAMAIGEETVEVLATIVEDGNETRLPLEAPSEADPLRQSQTGTLTDRAPNEPDLIQTIIHRDEVAAVAVEEGIRHRLQLGEHDERVRTNLRLLGHRDLDEVEGNSNTERHGLGTRLFCSNHL